VIASRAAARNVILMLVAGVIVLPLTILRRNKERNPAVDLHGAVGDLADSTS
jgi:hypothetical protein